MSAIARYPEIPLDLPRPGPQAAPPKKSTAPAPGVPVRDAAGVHTPRRVLAVGEERRTKRIRRALEASGSARVGLAVTAAEAVRRLEKEPFDTVVLAAPLRGARVEHALSQLRSLADPGAVYLALVPEDFESARVRELYERGARLVLAWPDDVSSLDHWMELAARLPDPLPAGDGERVERRMERAVRERLRLRLRRLAKGLAVDARAGVARLRGRVGSLWAKRAVERHVEASPGIRGVDAHALEVDAPERDDAAVAREIRALLDGVTTIDSSTMGVSVHDGRVVLMGAVLDDERDHALELISMVPGVRAIHDESSSSALQKWRARRRARRLQQRLRESVTARGLRVAVVGSTAVLRGVGSTREIHDARALLDRQVRVSRSLRSALYRAHPSLSAA